MARRLPIYFVLDVSESMAGEPIAEMETVIDSVLAHMRRDPHALETVWFSQIVFAAKPKMLSPLREITSFSPSVLPLGGGTGIGAMLRFLMKTLDQDRQVDSASGKSDWKPIVYIMTDGRSTDDTKSAVAEWNRSYRNKCLLVAISIGQNSDMNLLRSLTENVVVFMDSSPDAYARFASWMSRSVEESIKVASSPIHEQASPLASLERGLIETGSQEFQNQHTHDKNTIVVVGRCQKTKQPYLLRYSEATKHVDGSEVYEFKGSLVLKESYFELSDKSSSGQQVDVQELDIPGKCVSCGADHSLVLCSQCSAISCGNAGEPWCCPSCGLDGQIGKLDGPSYTNKGLG